MIEGEREDDHDDASAAEARPEDDPAAQDPAVREARQLRRGRARLGLVAALVLIGYGVVAWRMASYAAGSGASEQAAASAPARQGEPDRARADILDRNGEVLATNILAASIAIDPSEVRHKEDAARKLADALPDVDEARLLAELRSPYSPRFGWVERGVTPAEQEAAFLTGVPGLTVRREERRIYPNTVLASSLIGFVDGQNSGAHGVELSFDKELEGGEGAPPAPMRTSLDLRVQHILHEELAASMERFQAIAANGLVMDVTNGEILAWASLPSFDSNAPFDVVDTARMDRNLFGRFELGSVFKIFTFAGALDAGAMTLASEFEAPRRLYIGRKGIGDLHPIGRVASVPEIFKESSNTGTTNIAFALGAERQQEFLRRLGMFDRVPFDLANARCPQLPVATASTQCRQEVRERWGDLFTATVSFGHSISVTPLHLARAVAGVVNGGLMPTPTVLKRRAGEPVPFVRVVSEETSAAMRFLMWLVVEDGTATKARSDAYLVGGKTGTAEIPTGGADSRSEVISSFVGVFPIEAPRYLVLASLERPQGDEGTHGLRGAGWTAAPLVGRTIDRIGPILGVRPSDDRIEAGYRARLIETDVFNPMRGEMEKGVAARPIGG